MPRPTTKKFSPDQIRLLKSIDSLPEIGAIEHRVRELIVSLDSHDPYQLSLAEMAIVLSKKLDFDPGPQIASINKELRETLMTLVEVSGEPDDLLANLSDPL